MGRKSNSRKLEPTDIGFDDDGVHHMGQMRVVAPGDTVPTLVSRDANAPHAPKGTLVHVGRQTLVVKVKPKVRVRRKCNHSVTAQINVSGAWWIVCKGCKKALVRVGRITPANNPDKRITGSIALDSGIDHGND